MNQTLQQRLAALRALLQSVIDEVLKATKERDEIREVGGELANALEWAMEMDPSPCRCMTFATPPHVCLGHRALAQWNKVKGSV